MSDSFYYDSNSNNSNYGQEYNLPVGVGGGVLDNIDEQNGDFDNSEPLSNNFSFSNIFQTQQPQPKRMLSKSALDNFLDGNDMGGHFGNSTSISGNNLNHNGYDDPLNTRHLHNSFGGENSLPLHLFQQQHLQGTKSAPVDHNQNNSFLGFSNRASSHLVGNHGISNSSLSLASLGGDDSFLGGQGQPPSPRTRDPYYHGNLGEENSRDSPFMHQPPFNRPQSTPLSNAWDMSALGHEESFHTTSGSLLGLRQQNDMFRPKSVNELNDARSDGGMYRSSHSEKGRFGENNFGQRIHCSNNYGLSNGSHMGSRGSVGIGMGGDGFPGSNYGGMQQFMQGPQTRMTPMNRVSSPHLSASGYEGGGQYGSRSASAMSQQHGRPNSSYNHSPSPSHQQQYRNATPSQLGAGGRNDAGIEEMVCRTCRDILVEAANHTLKAVELANTLRARVGTDVLAYVREKWSGLLSLLERHPYLFRVERIPKNDLVCLVSADPVVISQQQQQQQQQLQAVHPMYLPPGFSGQKPSNEFGSFPSHTFGGPIAGGQDSVFLTRPDQQESDGGYETILNRPRQDAMGLPLTSPSPPLQFNKTADAQPSRCLHIGNVPANLNENQLLTEFEQFGEVETLKVVTQRNRRFAFVTYKTLEQAVVAKQRMSKIQSWKSAISFAHKESYGSSSSSSNGSTPSPGLGPSSQYANMSSTTFHDFESGTTTVQIQSMNSIAPSQHVLSSLNPVDEEDKTPGELEEMISGSRSAAWFGKQGSDDSGSKESVGVGPGDYSIESIPPTSPMSPSSPLTNVGGLVSFDAVSVNSDIPRFPMQDGGNSSSNLFTSHRGISLLDNTRPHSINSLPAIDAHTLHQIHPPPPPSMERLGRTASGDSQNSVEYQSMLMRMRQQQQQLSSYPSPRSSPMMDGRKEMIKCPVMRRLCDDTYVPTQLWPVDHHADAPYCAAVVSQLRQFGGQTTVSKLRGFLRSRLQAPDNIKSVPLKAMLGAYPNMFSVVGNHVSLLAASPGGTAGSRRLSGPPAHMSSLSGTARSLSRPASRDQFVTEDMIAETSPFDHRTGAPAFFDHIGDNDLDNQSDTISEMAQSRQASVEYVMSQSRTHSTASDTKDDYQSFFAKGIYKY